jgi:hypothetical protein
MLKWRQRVVAGTTTMFVFATLTGCLWSDPVLAPVPVRVDSGTISVMIPLCADDRTLSVVVSVSQEYGEPITKWTASAPTSVTDRRVLVLDAQHWGISEGSYAGLRRVGVTVVSEHARFGTVVDLSDRTLGDLGPGQFSADGTKYDTGSYAAMIERDFPCVSRSVQAIGVGVGPDRVGGRGARPPLTPPDLRARIRRFVRPLAGIAATGGAGWGHR